MRRVIGIGETVLDVIFRNDRPQDAIPGGSTFNAMISLGRTLPKAFPEVPVSMVTEIGDDHIGDLIISFMESNGVRTDYVTRNSGTQSHLSMAFLDSNNDAQYEFYKDHANAGLSEDIVSRVEFEEGDVVLFGSFFAINPVIRHCTRALLTKARDAGAILYYDINFRKSHIKDLPDTMDNILENCALSDFVRGSSEDFRYLFGTEDGQKIYDEHISPLCRNFILTRGPEPVQVFTGEILQEFPVEKIDTISTIGAGDNFNAGFIYALIQRGIIKGDCTCPPPDECRGVLSADEHRGVLSADECQSLLSPGDWWALVKTAGRVSSAVCRSPYNYVDADFRI